MLLGQPMDSVLAALAIIAVLSGFYFALAKGLPKFKTPNGKAMLAGGGAAIVVGFVLLSMTGLPIVPSNVTSAPTASGQWQVCLTNAGYATVGAGTCANSMVASKAVPFKVQPGINTTKDTADNNVYVYFNITVVAPSGSNKVAYNVISAVGSVPTLTNTTNPQTTAPVLGLRTGGQYDVLVTPSGGTGAYQTQVVPITPGTSQVIAFQVHFGRIIGQLALGQYPVGVSITFTVTDQSSGTVYGTVTLSETLT